MHGLKCFPDKQKRLSAIDNLLLAFVERELSLFHSLLELINTSACINELLLACIERVAVGADINSQIALCGKSLECVAACALNCDKMRLRMNSFFHVLSPLNQRYDA